MKALFGWLLVFALLFGLWVGLTPVRASNDACREAGAEPWPTGCYKKVDPAEASK